MKNTPLKLLPFATLLITAILFISGKRAIDTNQAIIWKIENTNIVGTDQPFILGNPLSVKDSAGSFVYFDGVDDGMIIQKIPIEGWRQFTIEVLFKPASDGPTDPRFIHFEDSNLNRGTFELRITRNGEWYMDTFLKNGKTNSRLTLIDSSKLHACNQWSWASMVYDGKTMSSYVNGQKELEGAVDFPPVVHGQISLGVRLNKVNWFKGAIKEIRFHPTALSSKDMQHQ